MASFAIIDERELVAVAEKAEAEAAAAVLATGEGDTVAVNDSGKPACKCTQRWIDEACIWRTLEDWTPEEDLLCWGCFNRKGGQRDHACLGLGGFSFIPDPCEDTDVSLKARTANILRNSNTQKELFAVYVQSHPQGVNLQRNLDWALQHLVKTRVEDLKELFFK